jgi:hypothetical protein
MPVEQSWGGELWQSILDARTVAAVVVPETNPVMGTVE